MEVYRNGKKSCAANRYRYQKLALDPNKNDTVYVMGEWRKSQTNIDDLEIVLKRGHGPIYADPAGKDALETLRRRGLPMNVAKKDILVQLLEAVKKYREARRET